MNACAYNGNIDNWDFNPRAISSARVERTNNFQFGRESASQLSDGAEHIHIAKS